MKYIKKTFACILCVYFTFFSSVWQYTLYAEETTTIEYSKKLRKKIIEEFKDKQYKQIFEWENIFVQEEFNFFDIQRRIEIYKKIHDYHQKKKEELIEQKEKITKRILSLEEMIAQLNLSIEESKKKIQSLTAEIMTLHDEITTLQENIKHIQIEILENKKLLMEYIAHVYKSKNLSFSDDNIDSLKAIFLNGGSLGDIFSELHFSWIIETTWQNLIEEHRALLRELYKTRLELKTKKQQFVELRKQELQERKKQLEQKQFREKLLAINQNKEKQFEMFIQEQVEIENNIKRSIVSNMKKIFQTKEEILQKNGCFTSNAPQNVSHTGNRWETLELSGLTLSWKETTHCETLQKILSAESKLKAPAQNTNNIFEWPVDPKYPITAYYKDPNYESIIGASHDGIDIAVPQGTEIRAPADGYITFLRKPDDLNYAYVALKHANGMVTVYGHVSEILFDLYDYIPAGTVFAKSWGAVGTKWAGFITTGPHLHFEVFKNKQTVDPLEYLSLADIEVEKLPNEQKYFYKFLYDYKEKYGIDYTGNIPENIRIFQLQGNTEEERQKYLLETYAAAEFKNWNIWVEEAMGGNIDPSFLMCIGLAETSLGRNLKSAYNVGNVGNTDSGDVWEFENARAWIYWIVNTLNNQFLWKYRFLSQLSRFWNKDGHIYASSSYNWHKNMVRCLSALKWHYISDNFEFRLQ